MIRRDVPESDGEVESRSSMSIAMLDAHSTSVMSRRSTEEALALDTVLAGLMSDSWGPADEAVFEFMRAARRLAKTTKNLARIASTGTDKEGGYAETTASMWSKDGVDRFGNPQKLNLASADVVVSMVRAFHAQGLSFDAYALRHLGEELPQERPLGHDALLQRVEETLAQTNRLADATAAMLLQASNEFRKRGIEINFEPMVEDVMKLKVARSDDEAGEPSA